MKRHRSIDMPGCVRGHLDFTLPCVCSQGCVRLQLLLSRTITNTNARQLGDTETYSSDSVMLLRVLSIIFSFSFWLSYRITETPLKSLLNASSFLLFVNPFSSATQVPFITNFAKSSKWRCLQWCQIFFIEIGVGFLSVWEYWCVRHFI